MSAEIARSRTLPPLPVARQSIVVPQDVAANESGVRVEGKFLAAATGRFWIKGVTYGSFASNDEGEPFPPLAQVRDDFAHMRASGINTVRLYGPPSDRIADAAADVGLRLIPDICWGPRRCELDDADRVRFIYQWTRQHARRLKDHPAVLMFSIGNEIPPLLVRWYGRRRIEEFLRTLYDTVKSESPDSLVTYVNHPPTEHLRLSFLDVVSFNIYLEREAEFRSYLARLQMLAGERPLFLAELGLDSHSHGTRAQADFLKWQLKAVWEKGLCGAAVYSWTDQWAIFGQAIEGWAFGLTDADRRPKPALAAVRDVYRGSLYSLRRDPWPRVSVVVASYNGARTLGRCLDSLSQLNYPDYEVIVVDDGSTDHTQSIVPEFDVRCIRVPNGGLSRARNLGIDAATGEIVAFLDSDAFADPDWLFYLVTALEEQQAVAVGGPNLSPPGDHLVAQCIDHAPGNPTHVLVADELAEHVPGCNMAFRKTALEAIGGFDPDHRAAGDDVDVCWKLLVRDEKIAFSPSAVVWHHRRPTVRAFWRQQVGYGFAEAHLQRRYPGRFNVFGDLVWAGSIYDSMHTALRGEGLPSLFRPRVYQGRFGSAQFQSIYQPFRTWWFQVFTNSEWQSLAMLILIIAGLALFMSPVAAAALLVVAALMTLATVAAALVPAVQACRTKKWVGKQKLFGLVLVAWLQVLQPWARTLGRLRGLWHTRHWKMQFAAEERLYGNLTQRDQWLQSLERHLRACGWVSTPTCDWGVADLDVLGPGPYRLQLCSVYEENLERGSHFVRYRITARAKPSLLLAVAGLAAVMALMPAAPYLLPLAIPTLIVLRALLLARWTMVNAVSQLAQECGAALQMTRVEAGDV